MSIYIGRDKTLLESDERVPYRLLVQVWVGVLGHRPYQWTDLLRINVYGYGLYLTLAAPWLRPNS